MFKRVRAVNRGKTVALATLVGLASGMGCSAAEPGRDVNAGGGNVQSGGSQASGGEFSSGGLGSGGGAMARTGGAMTSGGLGLTGGGLTSGGEQCADADVVTRQLIPTVWLVIDGTSASKGLWDVEREALLGPQGLVPELQSVVRFGGVVSNPNAGPGGCGAYDVAPAALNNLANLESVYPPGGEARSLHLTVAMRQTRDLVEATWAEIASDAALDGQAVVLSRHGNQLGICLLDHPELAWPNTPTAQQAAMIAAGEVEGFAQTMVDAGTQLFIYGAWPTEPSLQTRLAEIADNGHDAFPIDDAASLTAALRDALRDVISCDIALNGRVVAEQACEGKVELNEETLPCDDADGWRLKNEQTIELVGEACARFRNRPTSKVIADFPCGTFVDLE